MGSPGRSSPGLRIIDARSKFGEIDLAKRKIQQRRGDQNLYRRKQNLRISSALCVRLEQVTKQRVTRAARRIWPPWYGFKGFLAIAAQLAIASPSDRTAKDAAATPTAVSMPETRCPIRPYWSQARRALSAFMSPASCWPRAATSSAWTVSTPITIRR